MASNFTFDMKEALGKIPTAFGQELRTRRNISAVPHTRRDQ